MRVERIASAPCSFGVDEVVADDAWVPGPDEMLDWMLGIGYRGTELGAPGYLGTDLFARTSAPPCFLTLDRWETRAAYEAFRRDRAAEYSALDAACEGLTTAERFLSAWED